MKKIIKLTLTLLILGTLLVGCLGVNSQDNGLSSEISVISREDGSGTRGAFVELFNIEEKDSDGNKVDHTSKEATIAPKTDVMITNVSGDEFAIGYVSIGSLNEHTRQIIKPLKIDGVEARAENVQNKTYKIARPFNIATKGEPTELAQDFIDYTLSFQGQVVVSESYTPINDEAPSYTGGNMTGKIVIAGSSSVSPVIEKLKEAYVEMNPEAEIEIQTSDSTAGMNAAIDGTCDIGMASRSLKESEKEVLTDIEIAIDGIAVVVNTENNIEGITSEQVKQIFKGEITMWGDVE